MSNKNHNNNFGKARMPYNSSLLTIPGSSLRSESYNNLKSDLSRACYDSSIYDLSNKQNIVGSDGSLDSTDKPWLSHAKTAGRVLKFLKVPLVLFLTPLILLPLLLHGDKVSKLFKIFLLEMKKYPRDIFIIHDDPPYIWGGGSTYV
jgi:hypothetical protein